MAFKKWMPFANPNRRFDDIFRGDMTLRIVDTHNNTGPGSLRDAISGSNRFIPVLAGGPTFAGLQADGSASGTATAWSVNDQSRQVIVGYAAPTIPVFMRAGYLHSSAPGGASAGNRCLTAGLAFCPHTHDGVNRYRAPGSAGDNDARQIRGRAGDGVTGNSHNVGGADPYGIVDIGCFYWGGEDEIASAAYNARDIVWQSIFIAPVAEGPPYHDYCVLIFDGSQVYLSGLIGGGAQRLPSISFSKNYEGYSIDPTRVVARNLVGVATRRAFGGQQCVSLNSAGPDETNENLNWAEGHTFAKNKLCYDTADGHFYECANNDGVTGTADTFAAYRAANPTHWTQRGTPGVVAGQVDAQGVIVISPVNATSAFGLSAAASGQFEINYTTPRIAFSRAFYKGPDGVIANTGLSGETLAPLIAARPPLADYSVPPPLASYDKIVARARACLPKNALPWMREAVDKAIAGTLDVIDPFHAYCDERTTGGERTLFEGGKAGFEAWIASQGFLNSSGSALVDGGTMTGETAFNLYDAMGETFA